MSNLLIKVVDVKKSYYKNNKLVKAALKGVSLDVYEGEILTLLGVNGAGKTTLSSIISTLQPACSGNIFFENKSIYSDLDNYRLKVGFCPQKPNFMPMLNLEENLLFAGRFYGMSDADAKARLNQLAEKFGFTDYLKFPIVALSGGYKQRFSIAKSLMHSPKLLILDEPIIALDPQIRRALWNYIQELKKENISIILTTHYLDEAEFLSDRVCVIDNGLIKLIDTPQNLISNFKESNLEQVFIKLVQEETL